MQDNTCSIEECSKPLRSPGATWCAKHYHRWYRHGDPMKSANKPGAPSKALPRRYRRTTRKGHPLSNKYGGIWTHRLLLFEVIGFGPHPCHWCKRLVDWNAPTLPSHDYLELQVDHLDNDGGNNALTNLVPACRSCNSRRGSHRRGDALRDAGWWSNNDTILNRAERIEAPATPHG